jgi:hypothetical protein
MIMKQKIIFFIPLFLCSALFLSIGCTKTEDPQKPGLSSAAPSLPHSTGTEEKSTLPLAQVPPESISSSNKAVAPSAAPEKDMTPAVPGMTPVPFPPMPGKPAERDVVIVAGFDSAQMQKGAPAGWVLDRRKGAPSINLEKGSDIYCLHMRSDRESSFGIKRGIKVDIKEFPYLNWRWKAARLPDGGDVRKTHTDDQAMQFYVAFTPTGFPATLNTPVLGYVWDNEAPKGWTGRSTQIGGGKLRYVVVRNNTDQLGQWRTEKRNIYDDYRKLFKDIKGDAPPGLTHGVQFHINSQNTASEAEGYICEAYFSRK